MPNSRSLTGWLRKAWDDYARAQQFAGREDVNAAGIVVIAAVALSVISAMTFIDPVQQWTGFSAPALSTALILLALTTSLIGSRLWDRARVRNLALAVDTAFYCAFVVTLMAHTTSPIRYVFGLIFCQMAADYGKRLPFNWVTLGGVAIGALAFVAGAYPDYGVFVIVVFGVMIYAFMALVAAERIRLRRENAKLASALTAADGVATNSVDIALAASVAEMGGYVHHLRNALTPLVNHLRFLTTSESLVDDERGAIEAAHRSAVRSCDLLEKLVASIKERSAVVDVAFGLDTALRGIAESFKHDRRAAVAFPTELPPFDVRGNSDHLRMAVENLVRNAVEAGARSVIVALVVEDAHWVRLSIADDGPGIPEPVRAGMFERPVTHGKEHGHGFGLYLSRKLVELLGGSLALDATGPSGTRFSIRLPGHFRLADHPRAEAV